MTKEEAITALGDRNNLLWGMSKEKQKYYSEALDMAISALSENKGDLISRQAVENITWEEPSYSDPLNVLTEVREKVRALPSVENKGEWIPFSEELPPKGKKVHVSTYGIVTIGERTSEANEALRLSILEPMNNMYKNVDPYSYQITHWQPLPEPYKAEKGGE